MTLDWALAVIVYRISRFVFPVLTFGRVQVAAWETRAVASWSVKRRGHTQIELGPDLAGLLVCGLLAMEAFSLMSALAVLQRLLPWS